MGDARESSILLVVAINGNLFLRRLSCIYYFLMWRRITILAITNTNLTIFFDKMLNLDCYKNVFANGLFRKIRGEE